MRNIFADIRIFALVNNSMIIICLADVKLDDDDIVQPNIFVVSTK